MLRKAAQYVLVLWLALTITFLLPRFMPGSPLAFATGLQLGAIPAEARARIISDAGLDRPLHEQYLRYLGQVLQGDLGYSFQERRSVAAILADRLPWTMLLTGTAIFLSTLIGVLAGALAAWRRGRRTDIASIAFFVGLGSLPGFWVGMLLIATFGVQLRWAPIFGSHDVFGGLSGVDAVIDVARHLALPALTLTLITTPATFFTLRSSMVGVLGAEYLKAARARGISERRILLRHALRNAILPLAALVGIRLGVAIQGATLVETVFSYPGVGRTIYEAALSRDFPLLQGTFVLMTVSVLLASILSDLLYPLLDPRVRVGSGNGG